MSADEFDEHRRSVDRYLRTVRDVVRDLVAKRMAELIAEKLIEREGPWYRRYERKPRGR